MYDETIIIINQGNIIICFHVFNVFLSKKVLYIGNILNIITE